MTELRQDGEKIFHAAVDGDGCKIQSILQQIPMKEWEDVLKNVNTVFHERGKSTPELANKMLQINVEHNSSDSDVIHFEVLYSSRFERLASLVLSETVDSSRNKIVGQWFGNSLFCVPETAK